MSWEVSVDLANGNLEVVDRGQDRNELGCRGIDELSSRTLPSSPSSLPVEPCCQGGSGNLVVPRESPSAGLVSKPGCGLAGGFNPNPW
ncbi:hypothetical protein V6N11_027230 [Hibiscus sabdariffa]|uniref:Uncharacterized protein n=1 Tax=Hibiscus sabdariffa TaxID=183260 RepID=A0ABR2PH19_9ROSI